MMAETPPERRARRLGMLLQVLVLGQLLVIALGGLYIASSGARIFRYAGF
jgi:hypothetical protein